MKPEMALRKGVIVRIRRCPLTEDALRLWMLGRDATQRRLTDSKEGATSNDDSIVVEDVIKDSIPTTTSIAFVCVVCKAQFRLVESMKRHLRTHGTINPGTEARYFYAVQVASNESGAKVPAKKTNSKPEVQISDDDDVMVVSDDDEDDDVEIISNDASPFEKCVKNDDDPITSNFAKKGDLMTSNSSSTKKPPPTTDVESVITIEDDDEDGKKPTVSECSSNDGSASTLTSPTLKRELISRPSSCSSDNSHVSVGGIFSGHASVPFPSPPLSVGTSQMLAPPLPQLLNFMAAQALMKASLPTPNSLPTAFPGNFTQPYSNFMPLQNVPNSTTFPIPSVADQLAMMSRAFLPNGSGQ